MHRALVPALLARCALVRQPDRVVGPATLFFACFCSLGLEWKIDGGGRGIQEGGNKNVPWLWLLVMQEHQKQGRSGCEMLEGKEAVERFIRGKQGPGELGALGFLGSRGGSQHGRWVA
jgi:hypothetical protein